MKINKNDNDNKGIIFQIKLTLLSQRTFKSL
jgi:hypothetical protein